MSEVSLGQVITVIENVPCIFNVKFLDLGPNSIDPLNRLPFAYVFNQNPKSTDKKIEIFVVKITDELSEFYFYEDIVGMHHKAIQYGLYNIRQNPDRNEFMLTTDEYKAFNNRILLKGKNLRQEILRFIFEVNETIPDQGVSIYDLVDNFGNPKEEIGSWVKNLYEAGYIKCGDRQARQWIERGQANVDLFLISPKKYKEIEAEIQMSAEGNEKIRYTRHTGHTYYKLIDIQPEAGGKFAFVLMPFNEKEFPQNIFGEVFVPIVKDKLDMQCVRVDDDKLKNFIENKIFSHIVKSEFIIAELSTENRNVIFELGLAMALEKIIILTFWNKYKTESGKLSFDYEHFDTIFYNNYEDLKKQLTDALNAIKRNESE